MTTLSVCLHDYQRKRDKQKKQMIRLRYCEHSLEVSMFQRLYLSYIKPSDIGIDSLQKNVGFSVTPLRGIKTMNDNSSGTLVSIIVGCVNSNMRQMIHTKIYWIYFH